MNTLNTLPVDQFARAVYTTARLLVPEYSGSGALFGLHQLYPAALGGDGCTLVMFALDLAESVAPGLIARKLAQQHGPYHAELTVEHLGLIDVPCAPLDLVQLSCDAAQIAMRGLGGALEGEIDTGAYVDALAKVVTAGARAVAMSGGNIGDGIEAVALS